MYICQQFNISESVALLVAHWTNNRNVIGSSLLISVYHSVDR